MRDARRKERREGLRAFSAQHSPSDALIRAFSKLRGMLVQSQRGIMRYVTSSDLYTTSVILHCLHVCTTCITPEENCIMPTYHHSTQGWTMVPIEKNSTPSSSASSSHLSVRASNIVPDCILANSLIIYGFMSHCASHRLYNPSHFSRVSACHRNLAAGAGMNPS